MSNYTPDGTKLNFTFTELYVPSGGELNLDFNKSSDVQPSESQYIYPASWDDATFGDVQARLWHSYVRGANVINSVSWGSPSLYNSRQDVLPKGFFTQTIGQNSIKNFHTNLALSGFIATIIGSHNSRNSTHIIRPSGFVATHWGIATYHNRNLVAYPQGFLSSDYGRPRFTLKTTRIGAYGFVGTTFGANTIGNWYRFLLTRGHSSSVVSNSHRVVNRDISTRVSGFNALRFGQAAIQNYDQIVYTNKQIVGAQTPKGVGSPKVLGGVHTVYARPIYQMVFGEANLLDISVPRVIFPLGNVLGRFGAHLVSPRFIYVRPTSPQTRYGVPNVRVAMFSPKGFDSMQFGLPLVDFVSTGTKEIEGRGFDSLQFEQYPKVRNLTSVVLIDNAAFASGVFGSIHVFNSRRYVHPEGFTNYGIFDWHKIFLSDKLVYPKEIDATLWGVPTFIKTPELFPVGIDSNTFGAQLVSAGVRTIRIGGGDQMVMGKLTVEKTPSFEPRGWRTSHVGEPEVTLYTRWLYAHRMSTTVFGQTTIWHRTRWLHPSGLFAQRNGDATVTHRVRTILHNGVNLHSRYGVGRITLATRIIAPKSIIKNVASNHRVGGTQYVVVEGLNATRFGSRIIPESHLVSPQSILGLWGLPDVYLKTRYVVVRAFQEGSVGTVPNPTIWNLRQYVTQTFDAESGLVPPKNDGWTAIYNRNRYLGAVGEPSQQFGYTSIANNARLLEPIGFGGEVGGAYQVAYRVRHVAPQEISMGGLGSWLVIHNTARELAPVTLNQKVTFGLAKIENTRREFKHFTVGMTLIFGLPMIADRIRGISQDRRYAIQPPILGLPEVKLYTRYIDEVTASDQQRVSMPSLSIHWNIIKAFPVNVAAFGLPTLKNLTPELFIRPLFSEEFGRGKIYNSDQHLRLDGFASPAIPRPNISYRTKRINVSGFAPTRYGKPELETGVSPPYSLQHIVLEKKTNDGEIANGHGIPIPTFPRPYLNQNLLLPSSWVSSRIGTHWAQINLIDVEYGIHDKLVGRPTVYVLLQKVAVEGFGVDIAFGKPRLSPHTIYAPTEAPSQAVQNHPLNPSKTPINSGAKIGSHRVQTWRGRISMSGIGAPNINSSARARVSLSKRTIEVMGIYQFRMGAVWVGDGKTRVQHFSPNNQSLYGRPTVARVVVPTTPTIRVTGMNVLRFSNTHWVSLKNREVSPRGFLSQSMGNSRGGTLYMPQSLHVGFPNPVKPIGQTHDIFGKTWVEFRVRGVSVGGFDTMSIGYDYTNFQGRMKVIKVEVPIASQTISTTGIASAIVFGVPNQKLAVHYIRPDGNSDHYRKGAF